MTNCDLGAEESLSNCRSSPRITKALRIRSQFMLTGSHIGATGMVLFMKEEGVMSRDSRLHSVLVQGALANMKDRESFVVIEFFQ